MLCTFSMVAACHKTLRAIQFATLPIVLPFFPLLYTDVTSLFFVLFAVFAALRRMPLRSSILITAAIGIRQNNVLWVPLLPALLLSQSAEWLKYAGSGGDPWHSFRKCLRNHSILRTLILSSIPFLLPLALFCIYAIANGSPVLNRTPYHPFPAFFLGNAFLTLALVTLIFFPLALSKLRVIVSSLQSSSGRVPFFALIAILFWMTFSASHPFNQHPDSLRGSLLLAVAGGGWPKVIFCLLLLFGLLTVVVTELTSSLFLLLYPLSIVFLSTVWLIDNRYAMIPLSLFLLFRKPLSWRMEVLQFAFNILLCLLVFS